MAHLIDLTVELPTVYASEAERLRHKLIERLMNDESVEAFTCSPVYDGELPDGSEDR